MIFLQYKNAQGWLSSTDVFIHACIETNLFVRRNNEAYDCFMAFLCMFTGDTIGLVNFLFSNLELKFERMK